MHRHAPSRIRLWACANEQEDADSSGLHAALELRLAQLSVQQDSIKQERALVAALAGPGAESATQGLSSRMSKGWQRAN